ncbi:MAG TPA: hypothetical protein VGO04_22120 [Ensifer sp.]|jgi:hypothetical protein|uniref:hypothetical protein n=1 Tax=Ensifer sp. TaxID=1872086 RepID=UPI002E0DB946|nr:hypothetical protein [Ensifer sp.]
MISRLLCVAAAMSLTAGTPALADLATSIKTGKTVCTRATYVDKDRISCKVLAAKKIILLAMQSNYEDNRKGCASLARLLLHPDLKLDPGWSLVLKNTVIDRDKVVSCRF